MRIISIASGKGGVGKSLLSANLGIALAQHGKKVILADMDLGGSNLHLLLGHVGSQGLGMVLNNPKFHLKDVLYPTDYENLSFIPGEAELPGAANIKSDVKKRLMTQLMSFDADYLILDLGAGTSFNIMDFFLLSGFGILVTAPTLTSTLNAYLFLKNAVFRVLNSCITRKSPVFSYLENLKNDGVSLQKIHVNKLLESIKTLDGDVYGKFQEKIQHLRPRLVMNMLEDPKDITKSKKLRLSAREYLGVHLEHLGLIYRDPLQDKALQSQLPIIIYKPNSVLSQAVYRIAEKLLEMEFDESGPLTSPENDYGFQYAAGEAEADFNSKLGSLEELLHSGVLTQGDLIETIQTQQMEISTLKKENRFLKSKILKAVEAGYKL